MVLSISLWILFWFRKHIVPNCNNNLILMSALNVVFTYYFWKHYVSGKLCVSEQCWTSFYSSQFIFFVSVKASVPICDASYWILELSLKDRNGFLLYSKVPSAPSSNQERRWTALSVISFSFSSTPHFTSLWSYISLFRRWKFFFFFFILGHEFWVYVLKNSNKLNLKN